MKYMMYALNLAKAAQQSGEVPIGAVIVKDNQIIGEGFNQSIQSNDPTAHAEIVAIREAGKHLENYRLKGATLYVTLEPCPMCVGAIVHARIDKIVYAADDPKTGAINSVLHAIKHNHTVEVESGILAEESSLLLKRFFQERRQKEAVEC